MRKLTILLLIICSVVNSQEITRYITKSGNSPLIQDNKPLLYTPTLIFPSINQYFADRNQDHFDLPTVYPLTNEILHPDVIDYLTMYDKKGTFGGYRFWMVATPLPEADPDTYETPHVYYSNSASNGWQPIPDTILTPITLIGYNSDPDLYYENDTMYCFWRRPGGDIVFKTTTDGMNWSSDSTFFTTYYTRTDTVTLLSPSFIKDKDNKLRTYFCERYGDSDFKFSVNYQIRDGIYDNTYDSVEVTLIDTNSIISTLDTTGVSNWYYAWHINVNYLPENQKYYMIIYYRASDEDLYGVYLAESNDGDQFTLAKYNIFEHIRDTSRGGFLALWDNGYYRESITPFWTSENELKWNMFYSAWKSKDPGYPPYIGHSILEAKKDIDIFADSNYTNSRRIAQLDSACALQGSYIFADDFNRASFGTISCSGTTYNIIKGGFTINGEYMQGTGSDNRLFWNIDSSNYQLEMELNWKSVVNMTLTFKINGTTTNNAIRMFFPSGYMTTEVIGTAASIWRDDSFLQGLYTDQLNYLKVKFVGTEMTLWINGRNMYSRTWTDADFTGVTAAEAMQYKGMGILGNATPKFKNITVKYITE